MIGNKRSWLSTPEAAWASGVTERTIRNWVKLHAELGKRVGGRWRIDCKALRRVLSGEIKVLKPMKEKEMAGPIA
jgi:hypothetical protein